MLQVVSDPWAYIALLWKLQYNLHLQPHVTVVCGRITPLYPRAEIYFELVLCTQQMHSVSALSRKTLNIYPIHVSPPLPKHKYKVKGLLCICAFAFSFAFLILHFVILEKNTVCLACWRNTDIFTEKVESYMTEENPGEMCGSFAWISTERFGPCDGNRPWSFIKVLQSSLFPLLFFFKYDDWGCLDAELIWTKNKYLLKQDLRSLVSQKVCSGIKQCIALGADFLGWCLICVNCEILILLHLYGKDQACEQIVLLLKTGQAPLN